MKKEVAVIVEAPVQFYSIKSTIDKLIGDKRSVEIIVPYLEKYKVVTSAAETLLRGMGYTFVSSSDIKKRQYKVCLAPYPVVNFGDINAKYRIRYGYSILTAKPNPTYLPGHKLWFDAIICHSPQEAEIMSAYTRTYNISPMKYDGFNKLLKKGKPVLLYLPTSGDVSSADQAEEIVRELGSDYRVIVRMHAHTAHKQNQEEIERYEAIKRIADEVCDDTSPLQDWLKGANVVLSDNSGSIYEAIYSKTPVAVFSSDVKSRKLGNILPLHAKLIDEGVIPYGNEISDLKKLIKSAMSSAVFKRQLGVRSQYFNTSGDGTKELVKIIDTYLLDKIDQERWWLHHNMADEWYGMVGRIQIANEAYRDLQNQKEELEQQLNAYTHSRSHRFVKKAHRLKSKLRGIKLW